MQDLLKEVNYRPLSDWEKDHIHTIMATGNLTVEAIASKPGMEWSKRDAYRKVILGLKHSDCSPQEIAACRAISPEEKAAIIAVESIKHRLLEGMAARLVQIVRRFCYFARLLTENKEMVRQELSSEALLAFSHAVWRFKRYDMQFNTFLTTVVNNWLADFCERYQTGLSSKLDFDRMPSPGLKPDAESVFNEITQRLTPVQQAVIRRVAEGETQKASIKAVAESHSLSVAQVAVDFRSAREYIFANL